MTTKHKHNRVDLGIREAIAATQAGQSVLVASPDFSRRTMHIEFIAQVGNVSNWYAKILHETPSVFSDTGSLPVILGGVQLTEDQRQRGREAYERVIRWHKMYKFRIMELTLTSLTVDSLMGYLEQEEEVDHLFYIAREEVKTA